MRALQPIACAAALAIWGTPLGAAEVPSALDHKVALVARMLDDSPVSSRIASSGNEQARGFLASAREHYEQAQSMRRAGNPMAADVLLNESMWLIGKARQLVPDSEHRAIEQRLRYAQYLASIQSLQTAYARHVARTGRSPALAPAQLEAMIDEARGLATAERIADANRVLAAAEQNLLAGLNQVLGSATLDYTARFSTPAEEFGFELERNRSYLDLVPVAVKELRPSPDAQKLIERYVARGRAMREAAEGQAAQRDYGLALRTVREATGTIQRALVAAGLDMPREP